jgi:hypothetical protein
LQSAKASPRTAETSSLDFRVDATTFEKLARCVFRAPG